MREAADEVRALIDEKAPDICAAIRRRLFIAGEGLPPGHDAAADIEANLDAHEQVVEKLRLLSAAFRARAEQYETALDSVSRERLAEAGAAWKQMTYAQRAKVCMALRYPAATRGHPAKPWTHLYKVEREAIARFILAGRRRR